MKFSESFNMEFQQSNLDFIDIHWILTYNFL